MEQRNIHKCLISSPGDCQEERKACQKVIDKINNGLAKHLGINFETLMWENDVLPDMEGGGQEVIDETISNSRYDIFIGIMKTRFGHPTKKAGSGTEHEFNDALDRKIASENSSPRILFFFGKEKVDPDTFDAMEYGKVKSFKTIISSKGLYIDYSGLESFESNLNNVLELYVKANSPVDKPNERVEEVDSVLKKLENDLQESLKTYNEKSPVWIEPIISSKREVPNHADKNLENRVELESIIKAPSDLVIKAPSEFGLTSLAHHLKLEAWKSGKTFLYIDVKTTKKHKIVKDIKREIRNYFFKTIGNLDCILLDSVCFEESGVMQIVKNICDEFENIPLIIFNSLDNNFFLKSDEDDQVEIKRKFISYYLLPLRQEEVRKIVSSYANMKPFEEDKDVILDKVTKDLTVLNMHKTVKNCMSILRASLKIGSDHSPVNRTKLLETILNSIFEEYHIPTYHDKKPDVKDCSFVLGYFSELLVKRNDFEFTEGYFKSELRNFCELNLINLDITYLLGVLIDNSILGKKGGDMLYFKNSYWLFYFLAQRMNMNKAFLKMVYKEKKYIDYPEIIEFYTGIDRNKDDALRILKSDVDETLAVLRSKVKIPDTLNPFKAIAWKPDIEVLKKEEAKIGENVISSGLPDEVKDQYENRQYDQIRPYNQVINSVLRDYSFSVLMKQICAISRALRNSDFVDASLKRDILDKIVESWNEINKLLIILSPLLADRGNITFEGAQFYLEEEEFSYDNKEEKRLAVLLSLPTNVVKIFKDDLFSVKMGPLIIDKVKTERNSLLKHELMLLIIAERPREWNKIIDQYIVSLDKNSFFLSDVLLTLQFNKEYKLTQLEDRRIIDLLARKCRAKHIYQNDNPDLGLIKRVPKT